MYDMCSELLKRSNMKTPSRVRLKRLSQINSLHSLITQKVQTRMKRIMRFGWDVVPLRPEKGDKMCNESKMIVKAEQISFGRLSTPTSCPGIECQTSRTLLILDFQSSTEAQPSDIRPHVRSWQYRMMSLPGALSRAASSGTDWSDMYAKANSPSLASRRRRCRFCSPESTILLALELI